MKIKFFILCFFLMACIVTAIGNSILLWDIYTSYNEGLEISKIFQANVDNFTLFMCSVFIFTALFCVIMYSYLIFLNVKKIKNNLVKICKPPLRKECKSVKGVISQTEESKNVTLI